jgi:hypothetical protein
MLGTGIAMPPHLEFIVSILEILAFLLVTPEVLGREKLEAAYRAFERLGDWLNRWWFAHQPVSLSQVATMLGLVALLGLSILGLAFDERWVVAPFAIFTLVPAAVVLFVRHLSHKAIAIRVMALLGALFFLIGRGIVLANAWSRM